MVKNIEIKQTIWITHIGDQKSHLTQVNSFGKGKFLEH